MSEPVITNAPNPFQAESKPIELGKVEPVVLPTVQKAPVAPAALVPAAPLKSVLVAAPTLVGQLQGQIVSAASMPRKDRRADLLWGRSKVGKGENAFRGAYWMLQNYRKKFLYLTAEPGSVPINIQNAIEAGWGDLFSVVGVNNLLAVLFSVLDGGKWPVYRKLGADTIIRDFKTKEAECDPAQYGLLIVDSLTSLGDELIKWLADPDNKATLPMTPGKDKFWISDSGDGLESIKIGGSSMTHVGFATRTLQQLVVASANLPYQKVLWLSREQRASRGEKKDKDGNILVAGEPMYGPDLPGTAATPRVTGWFGGAYHCDAVPVGGTKDTRADIPDNILPTLKDKLSIIPDWEYRIYLRPHPDPHTGIFYDAGNRLPSHLNANSEIVPSFFVCAEKKVNGKFVHSGLNSIWDIEKKHGTNDVDDMKAEFADLMKPKE